MSSLKDKVALVTGSSRGIGAAIATHFADHGAAVVVHGRDAAAVPAAKAGIQILTQDLAAQAGPYGVRVNCVSPETILTERNQQQIPEAVQEQLAGMHPLRRLGTPEDVARAAFYLASDEAAWITGVVLDVAGGAVLV